MEGEFIQIDKENSLAIYQQDMAIIDTQIATAKKYPRDVKKCTDESIYLCTIDEKTAKECAFSLVKGGKKVEGKSVYMARIMFQVWGNLRAENKVVSIDDDWATCQGTVLDLQKNNGFRTETKRPVRRGDGSVMTTDMKTIVANAGNAIVFRNAIFGVIPKSVSDKVYEAVKEKLVGKISNENELTARRIKMIQYFKDTYPTLNLIDEEICMAIGKQSVSHLDKDDIFTLIGLENAIKSGEQSAMEVFRPTQPKQQPRDKSEERLETMIANAKTKAELERFKDKCTTPTVMQAYDKKMSTF